MSPEYKATVVLKKEYLPEPGHPDIPDIHSSMLDFAEAFGHKARFFLAKKKTGLIEAQSLAEATAKLKEMLEGYKTEGKIDEFAVTKIEEHVK